MTVPDKDIEERSIDPIGKLFHISDLVHIDDREPEDIEPEVQQATEEERQYLENEKLRVEIDSLDQDRIERKTYAGRVFWLVVAWLSSIGIILLLQGFGFKQFQLSDSVLLMLIGTTTGSVVGIFLIIANYLFPRRQ